MTEINQNNNRLGAIFGQGRSGTTWLGAIVDSHPQVCYRFEPFRRIKVLEHRAGNLARLNQSQSLSSEDVREITSTLLRAFPEFIKPSFHQKSYRKRFPFGEVFMLAIARKNPAISKLFEYLYAPQGNPYLIFKEVGCVNLCINLLKTNELPLVYLVRHPCAVIHSVIEGQKKGLMASGRRTVLENLLRDGAPHLFEQWKDKLKSLSIYQQETLMWLADLERIIPILGAEPNQGLLVFYEALTEDPINVSQDIFSHLGLKMESQSIDFIKESTGMSADSTSKRTELLTNPYFSVYRNPKIARDRWKTEISDENRREIIEIVSESQIFQMGMQKGLWSQ